MSSHSRYHFAYADNMNEENARLICPGATFEGVAELRGYRLIFTPHGRASLKADAKSSVWGIVWCLSNRDIYNLEKNEEEHLPDYRRTPVKVHLADGRQVEAFCYISIVSGVPQVNRNLLTAMIADAEYWGLPAQHLNFLRNLLAEARTTVNDS